jgi:hydroxyethylthiazole kinase-like uncharacterized protein yjeF
MESRPALKRKAVMEVLTSEQMKKVDEETIATVCPGLELMERAGKAVADYIHLILNETHGEPFKAVVFAGPGNNGGDGLVVARHLCEKGCQVSVHLLKSADSFTMDARKNYWRLSQLIKTSDRIRQLDGQNPDWPLAAADDLLDAQVIVDGLFGTGIAGAPRGRALDMIELINSSEVPVVSIDVPSGVQGDTGAVPGAAVRAAHTVTIGRPKLGLLFYPGKSYVGEMTVADIGFPDKIIRKHAGNMWVINWEEASNRLGLRPPDAHKYQCGTLLVTAGSRMFTGAAMLTAAAALRGGCGMVYLAVPEGIRNIVQGTVWEAITVPLPETSEGTIAPEGVPLLSSYLDRADALAIGPGLSRHPDTDRFVMDLLARADLPVVLDADGLNVYEGRGHELSKINTPLVLTPHSGELKRLMGTDIPAEPTARIQKTRDLARAAGAVLLHKGAPSLVASPGGEVWINAGGSSALATAGTGDVLTGLVGSFLAQGRGALDAALLGTFLHGKAGEYAAMEMGVRGVVAGDLLWEVGQVLIELEDLLPDGSPFRPDLEEPL